MADIETNVNVNIDTSDALAQLKLLQQQISAFQQAMRNAGQANAKAAAAMQSNLVNSINATGKFQANIKTIQTSAERFTSALEKNKLTMGEYFRYAGGASKTFGKLFKSEFETINQVARERVKDLQTQYVKLGRDANGAMKAISVRPLALDMDNLGTKTQLAAQKQQLFNQLMKQGSTQLLNFGKNTQWAGRQLMVGFTIPLTLMGSAAAKSYMEIEKASISFRRVYGDINTTTEEANKMATSVQKLATEFTKYGLSVADTMDMAAKAAAMGKTGNDLLAQVQEATRLAVLGGVDQNQALETTISLTNAFGTSSDQLAGKIDFLNAVENQTVTSIEDLTIAIPKAAPVIRQLGGNVEDLAFFLTAMKEGGINASEGANALKSGIASLINPTGKATEFLAKFGINIKGIVEGNSGNIKQTVIEVAKAFDTLDPLNRARAIEQMFGKFQFSRISTLFQNVIQEGSQASTVAGLAKQTTEELAILSERELKKVSDSPMFKFQKSIEGMQAKLAPIGEAFLKAVTPIIEFVSKILDGFNNLSDGAKNFITILVTVVAGIGPVLLMTFGLIANGVANIMKMFTNMKSFINKTTKPSDILGEQTSYMNTEQLRAAAIASSLDQAHSKLRQTFTSEAAAVDALTQAYQRAVNAQGAYAGIPGVPVAGARTAPKKYANGVSMVPGPAGAGDIIPALLSPGEAVIPAKQAQKYRPVLSRMIAGNLPGFEEGTPGAGMRQSFIGPMSQKQTDGVARTAGKLDEISKEVYAGPYGKIPATNYGVQVSPSTGHSFPGFGIGGVYKKPDGTEMFVKPQLNLVSALAELRGTEIARSAHGLDSPKQKIATMMDPTDPENRRKFIVLESLAESTFAKVPTSFSQGQYFKQLVASLLRGDKDLGLGNLGGNVLADVGPAGVFPRASGNKTLGSKINSMEEQAIINLLGVKGGAKRFFAESTAEMVSKMTPEQFSSSIKSEIQTVMPKLQSTISGFGKLNPQEKAAYMQMQQRLQAGMSVDWGKYQVMHSAVPPKKFELGGFVDEDEDEDVVSKTSTPLDVDFLSRKQNETQLAHIQAPWVKGTLGELLKQPGAEKTRWYAALAQGKLLSLHPGIQEQLSVEVLGSLVADVPGELNQYLRPKGGGVLASKFPQLWSQHQGSLLSTLARGGHNRIKEAGVRNAAQQINNEIGLLATENASIHPGTNQKIVLDKHVADASKQVLAKYLTKNGDDFDYVAQGLQQQADTYGEIRVTSKSLGAEQKRTAFRQMLDSRLLAFSEKNNPTIGKPILQETVFEGDASPNGRWQLLPNGFDSKKQVFRHGWNSENREALAKKYNYVSQSILDATQKGLIKLPSTRNATERGKFGYSTTSQKNAALEIRKLVAEIAGNAPGDDNPLIGAKFEEVTKKAVGKRVKNGVMQYADGTADVQLNAVKPKAAIFDVDDTLINTSEFMERFHAGGGQSAGGAPWHKHAVGNVKPMDPTIARLRQHQAMGEQIIIMTSRPSRVEDTTRKTLEALGIDTSAFMFMGRQDKDYTKAGLMKAVMTKGLSAQYDITGFYDDLKDTRAKVNKTGVVKATNPLKLAMGGMVPGYADGVFSVPGPKGAGDVVPAMLSPGEAVIPANRAAQYRPMIKQMISGNLPGYKKGIPGVSDPGDAFSKDFDGNLIYPTSSSSSGQTGLMSSIADSAKKMADAAVSTSRQAAAAAGRGAKQAGTRILDSNAANTFANYLSGGGKKTERLEEEKKQNEKAARARALAARKYLKANDEEYMAATKRVAQLNEKIQDGKELTAAELEEFKAQRKLMLDKKKATRDDMMQQQIDSGVGQKKSGFGKLFGRSQNSGKTMGAAYGISSGVGMLTQVPGAIGQGAQAVMGPIGAATAAMSMIPGPAGLIVAALAALVIGFMQLQEHFAKLRNESAKLAKDMGTSNVAINKFAEFAKTVSGTEAMDKRREGSAGQFFNIVQGKTTFGESYMKSDAGKELVKTVDTAISKGDGLENAKKQITNQLSSAITAGVLNPAQARSIAANLGVQLGDMNFGLDVTASLTDIMGPNGENLKKDPLEVRMKIVQSSMDQVKNNASAAEKIATTANPVVTGDAAVKGGVGAVGGAVATYAAITASSVIVATRLGAAVGSFLPGMGTLVGALAGAAAGIAIAMISYQAQLQKVGAALSESITNTLEVQQQMVDSLQIAYEKRIAGAKAEGDTAEAIRLQNQYLTDQKELMNANKKTNEEILVIVDESSARGALNDTVNTSIEKAYEGSGMEMQAKLAREKVDSASGSEAQEIMIKQALATKQLGLGQATIAINAFGGSEEEMKTLLELLNSSPVELNRTLSLASNLTDEGERKTFLTDMSNMDPAQINEVNDALELANKVRGVFQGKASQAIVDFSIENEDKMIQFKKNIDLLKDKDTITVEIAAKTIGLKDLSAFNSKFATFSKYNKQNKIVFTTALQQIMSMEGDEDMIASWNLWNKENGQDKSFADYAAYQADRTVTAAGIDNTRGEGSATATEKNGPEASILDPYVAALRDASNYQQKLTVGWGASLKALKNYTKQGIDAMAGLAVRMKFGGADSNFIQAVLGGTPQEIGKIINMTTGKLTETGKFLIAQTKRIEDAKIGQAYILMTNAERLGKANELYQAGLEVVSAKEKKINDRYDKRIKSLDEISKLQEKTNRQKQGEMDLADALSKGDISAAAKIALRIKEEQQKQALDDAKSSLELARKKELDNIEIKIDGKSMTRLDLESKIAINSEKIAAAKLIELNRQREISNQALISARASATILENGGKIAKLPGSNGTGGGNSVKKTDPVDDGKPPTDLEILKGVKTSKSAKPSAAQKQDFSDFSSEASINKGRIIAQNELYVAMAAQRKIESKLMPIPVNQRTLEQKQELEDSKKLVAEKTDLAKRFSNSESIQSAKDDLKSNLPNEIKIAFDKLKEQNTETLSLEKKLKAAKTNKTNFETQVGTNMSNYTEKEKKDYGVLTLALKTATEELYKPKAKRDSLWAALQEQGYDFNARKIFAGYANGGMVYASNGLHVESSKYALGTDTVPAMLTPGEFVMRKSAVERVGANKLNDMNSGTSTGESVYNYSITLNVNSSSDSNDIADAVLKQIKRIDSQRIRSSNI